MCSTQVTVYFQLLICLDMRNKRTKTRCKNKGAFCVLTVVFTITNEDSYRAVWNTVNTHVISPHTHTTYDTITELEKCFRYIQAGLKINSGAFALSGIIYNVSRCVGMSSGLRNICCCLLLMPTHRTGLLSTQQCCN